MNAVVTRDFLVVNAISDVVHWRSCHYATRGEQWLTTWARIGRCPEDRPCQFCLPDGLPS